ncbi:MAG: chemotaxis protein CheW [Firmicutes bacterium HGW-Firmicutes-14]|nr:MAG: chemotaxis protein CheW [Firmicutes bacterium HGW-Firmicutes-14]
MDEKQTRPAAEEKRDIQHIEGDRQFVVFILGKEIYGINISRVREIIPLQELTAIPRAAEYVMGVINLRGTVVPVYDLAGKLGIESSGRGRSTRIVVLEVRNFVVGIIVDMVSEVLRIPAEIIEAPSSVITHNLNEQFIEGIANCSDRLIILLNLDNSLVAGEIESIA